MPGKNQLKQLGGKTFYALLPEDLHALLKKLATKRADKFGGQVNINREIVSAIFVALTPHLTEAEINRIAEFIEQL